jgi:hypothetical protein
MIHGITYIHISPMDRAMVMAVDALLPLWIEVYYYATAMSRKAGIGSVEQV